MSELLFELVRRYSPSTQESAAVSYLVEWMQAHGFQAWTDEAGSACGMRGDPDAPRLLMLLGHIDTVPGEIPVRVEDGRLYGRGSVDAKGSLCAFAEAAAEASIPAGWRVMVVGAVEEESASSKGAHFIRERFAPTLCVIGEPSGSDRITLGYKGRLVVDVRLSQPVRHTAQPEPTVGALGAALWTQVAAWAQAQNTGIERYFDQIMASLRSINTQSDGFQETLEMTIGFRLPPHWTPDRVLAVVQQMTPPGAELRPYGMELAYQADRRTPLVRGMMAAIRARGGQPGFVLKTGTSDMNVVGAVWTCPMIAYGPGDSSLDHTPDEHLPLDEYARAAATVRHLIEHLESDLERTPG